MEITNYPAPKYPMSPKCPYTRGELGALFMATTTRLTKAIINEEKKFPDYCIICSVASAIMVDQLKDSLAPNASIAHSFRKSIRREITVLRHLISSKEADHNGIVQLLSAFEKTHSIFNAYLLSLDLPDETGWDRLASLKRSPNPPT